MQNTVYGREYLSKVFQSFLKENGIVHQKTVPYNSEQNGIAERFNRTLIERAKSILFDAKLHKKFWTEAINTASYLINRSIARATGKLPEELWTGEAVDLSNLKFRRR